MAAVAEKIFDEIDTPIGGVPIPQIMAVWPKVEPLLRRVVIPTTGYDLGSVLTQLQMGYMQLWVIGDFQAVAVTQIQIRPLHKVLWSQFIAGDHADEWLDDWEVVQAEYARANDCVAVEFSGRPGWRKFQQKYREYKPVLTTYRKEL